MLRVVLLHWLVWTAIALLAASQTLLTYVSMTGTASVRPVLILSFTSWYTWAALSPVIFFAARHLPLHEGARVRNAVAHVAINAVLALAYVLLYRTVRGTLGLPARNGWLTELISGLNAALLTYWSIVAYTHVRRLVRENRERAVQGAALARELAQARLDSLRAQLHPHFLFNTLHAIAAFIRTDSRRAEDMLAQLSDLLRIGLDTTPTHEVPLKDELKLAQSYLAIQQTRLGERLRITLDIQSDASGAAVPVLLLQPLLENAIEHGVARRTEGGSVQLRIVRDGARLRIEVIDDGGADRSAEHVRTQARRHGVGLANTRSRLEQLYGSDASLELVRLDRGGTCASVVLPFRECGGPVAAGAGAG